MRKSLHSIFCALALIVATAASAQNLTINLATPTLPPHVSDWSANPELITILLTPGAGGLELQNAHIVVEVANSAGKAIASTRTKFSEQPGITTVVTEPRRFRWMDIFNPSAVTLDPTIRGAAANLVF